jgi:hypothetical protein
MNNNFSSHVKIMVHKAYIVRVKLGFYKSSRLTIKTDCSNFDRSKVKFNRSNFRVSKIASIRSIEFTIEAHGFLLGNTMHTSIDRTVIELLWNLYETLLHHFNQSNCDQSLQVFNYNLFMNGINTDSNLNQSLQLYDSYYIF